MILSLHLLNTNSSDKAAFERIITLHTVLPSIDGTSSSRQTVDKSESISRGKSLLTCDYGIVQGHVGVCYDRTYLEV